MHGTQDVLHGVRASGRAGEVALYTGNDDHILADLLTPGFVGGLLGQFAGCVPGIHEVLRRHGLLAGRWCLDPGEELSPGQAEEIDRVWAAYPHLRDDEFIAENLDRWLA